MMNLKDLTIKKFNKNLLNGGFSATEVVKDFFSRIKDKEDKIGAYITLTEGEALSAAAEVDDTIAGGGEISVLAGVPFAIKDNILIEGGRTTAASNILKDYDAAYDATVIKKLKSNKAVFLGKSNLDDSAMGSSTESSAFKKTKNPHDLTRVPGGSSGGSAAAVAADMTLAALGSDTNGSIRQPASFCGVVGLKPTYGSVSRHGVIALGSSLDQIGPVTRTVEDAAIIFEAINGKDGFDSTTVDKPFKRLSSDEVKKLKIGIPREYFIEGISGEVKKGVEEAINKLKSLGFEFKDISLPHTKYAISVYYIILPAEASTNLARYDGIRYARVSSVPENATLKEIYFKNKGAGFGPEPKRRILLGTFVLSAGYYDAYYSKAQKVRSLIKQDFDEVFDGEVDMVLTPTAPTPAFKLGEKSNDPLSMYLADVFTSPSSLAGLPAISIPVKRYEVGSGELPVGFQLIGRHFREADILGVGELYEKD